MADPRMVDRYLQSRGAAPSAQNANRVREHFAANPDLLDRRAMGLPGGLDDNSGVLDGMLDKLIADTAATPAAPNASMPEASGTQGDRNPAPAPSKRGPVASARPGASRQGEYGPGASPSRQGGYGAASPPAMSGMVNEQGMPVEYTGEANVAPPEDSGILKWLLPILGISAAVPAAENLGPGRQRGGMSDAVDENGRVLRGPQAMIEDLGTADQRYNESGKTPRGPYTPAPPGALPPPQQRIGSRVGPNMESVGQEMETVTNRNASAKAGRERQLRSEVDAENDAMLRQMEEQARARKAQGRTKELTDAAKRAVGRR